MKACIPVAGHAVAGLQKARRTPVRHHRWPCLQHIALEYFTCHFAWNYTRKLDIHMAICTYTTKHSPPHSPPLPPQERKHKHPSIIYALELKFKEAPSATQRQPDLQPEPMTSNHKRVVCMSQILAVPCEQRFMSNAHTHVRSNSPRANLL